MSPLTGRSSRRGATLAVGVARKALGPRTPLALVSGREREPQVGSHERLCAAVLDCPLNMETNMKTTYTFHAAYDHSIVAALTDTAQFAESARNIAKGADHDKAQRFYVHNGVGVVSAFVVCHGGAHEVLRDDYMQFSAKAKAQRTAQGLEA